MTDGARGDRAGREEQIPVSAPPRHKSHQRKVKSLAGEKLHTSRSLLLLLSSTYLPTIGTTDS